MISKNEVKYIQSLYHKKNRDTEGVFIAESPKVIEEFVAAGFRMRKLYATEEWKEAKNSTTTTIITPKELEKISLLQAPNQVLAIIEQRKITNDPALNHNIVLVLDGIRDPGNMGTILRIADWFGVTQVVASEDTVELYNPKVIQSTMGSIARVNVWYKQLPEFLKKSPVNIYGALLNGESIKNKASITEGILVIGNESKGIRDEILPYIQYPVTIPRIGAAESLNAAVATGILLSYLRKSET